MCEKKPFSLMIIILGIALFFSYHIYYHFVSINNDNLVNNYFNKENSIQTEVVSKKSEKNANKEEYIGILTIPKINIKTGFYTKNSNMNSVDNSVTLLNESIMPENDNSIIYLAAHSGSGYLAFFKDLDKLNNEDMIYLNYNNKTYSYVVTDIYEMPRNGKITINRNTNEKSMVLTTCSNNNMQLVVISKLLNKI